MVKFQRSYLLNVSSEQPLDPGFVGPLTAEDEAARQAALEADTLNVTIQRPLTCEFHIIRDIMAEANTAVFRITGLGRDKQSKLYKDSFDAAIYRGIEFRAGYSSGGDVKADKLALCYKGNIKAGYSVREGNRMVTTLECQDGGFAFATGHISKGFSYGVKNLDLLREIVLGLNQPLPAPQTVRLGPGIAPNSDASSLTEDLLPTNSPQGGRGNIISGNAADLARERSRGGFFVDNEVAHVLADNEAYQAPFSVLTSASGLLGTPRRQDGFLTVEMLFEPRLLVGQALTLISVTEENFNGTYKVLGIRHSGVISGAVGGQAITTATLWFGPEALRILRTGRPNQ